MNRQEPGSQRQFGVLRQASCSQRSPMPAAIALKQAPSTVANHVVGIAVAAWAAKAPGPAGGLQHHGAIRLGANATEELGQRHAGLELESVEDYLVRSMNESTQIPWPKAIR